MKRSKNSLRYALSILRRKRPSPEARAAEDPDRGSVDAPRQHVTFLGLCRNLNVSDRVAKRPNGKRTTPRTL